MLAERTESDNRPFELREHGEPGRFITIEGLDGCGKSTLVRKLAGELGKRNYEVVKIRIPSDRMRKSWKFQLFHRQNRRTEVDPLAFEVAYMADRIHMSENIVLPALRAGTIVISDRYLLSSIGSLLIRAPELGDVVMNAVQNSAWFRDLAKGLIKPDAAFYLRADSEVAVERIMKRRHERAFDIEPNSYQQLVDEGVSLAESNGMHVVDTSHTSVAETLGTLEGTLSNVMKW